MKRILFLCMGNICRSPAAHCVFQHLVDQAGRSHEFEIESAGTIGFHIGEPPDGRMQAALRAHNIPVVGRSLQLEREDFDHYDLILAMDKDNLEGALSLGGSRSYPAKVELFGNYCREQPGAEVPDPYYGPGDGFARVLAMVQDGCTGLLETLT